MFYIQDALIEYLSIPVEFIYCTSNDKTCRCRKPNTGMLTQACDVFINIKWNEFLNKNQMIMIGDASGKQGQFSDSDKKTAENFGIDYMDVEDFTQTFNKQ